LGWSSTEHHYSIAYQDKSKQKHSLKKSNHYKILMKESIEMIFWMMEAFVILKFRSHFLMNSKGLAVREQGLSELCLSPRDICFASL